MSWPEISPEMIERCARALAKATPAHKDFILNRQTEQQPFVNGLLVGVPERWMAEACLRAALEPEDASEVERLRDLVDQATDCVAQALSCPGHWWYGSNKARRWLMEAGAQREARDV